MLLVQMPAESVDLCSPAGGAGKISCMVEVSNGLGSAHAGSDICQDKLQALAARAMLMLPICQAARSHCHALEIHDSIASDWLQAYANCLTSACCHAQNSPQTLYFPLRDHNPAKAPAMQRRAPAARGFFPAVSCPAHSNNSKFWHDAHSRFVLPRLDSSRDTGIESFRTYCCWMLCGPRMSLSSLKAAISSSRNALMATGHLSCRQHAAGSLAVSTVLKAST